MIKLSFCMSHLKVMSGVGGSDIADIIDQRLDEPKTSFFVSTFHSTLADHGADERISIFKSDHDEDA